MNKILITGATGNVGSEIVKQLSGKSDFRVGAYNIEKARQQLGEDVDCVHFNFLDPSTFAETFADVKRMFLIRPPALSNVQRDIAPAIYAAIGAGVEHITFLSIQGVEKNKVVPHYKIEQLLLHTGVDYTFLRASFFMQNLSTTYRDEIRDLNKIFVPVGKAKTSFIDARDIASVAVCCLTEMGHENKAYTLTGAEALDYYHVAEIMSETLERPIRYANPSAFQFLWQQIKDGQKLGFALVVTALYTITRFGNAKETTPDIEAVLDRKPIPFEQFVVDNKSCWMPHIS